jgi:multiple sugar transport system permease protein
LSERSEFCAGPRARAPQGSLRASAQAASAKRRGLPAHPFAAQTVHMKRVLDPAAIAVNTALSVAAVFALFPLLWMVSVSFMQPGAASSYPAPVLPAQATLDNYRQLFAQAGMGRYLLNSLAIACMVTAISVLFNVMAGYAFAKLRFAGREALFRSLLAALVIPGQVAMMPLFLMLKAMGLVNTWAGVIVPGMAGVFGIFLVRQYAKSLPDALLEVARMDGAGELRIFVSVILPLLKPVLVTLAVFAFLGSWNDFMWPLIVLTDGELYTAPVALASLSLEHVQDSELMMAGSVVTVLPVLLLFLGLQRYYLQGLTMGSVK